MTTGKEDELDQSKPVLVTGATGYVGARLISRLLISGYRVRAMGRSLAKLKSRSWGNHPMIELAEADVLDLPSLERAVRACGTVFYLVHSMIAQKKGFADADRRSARNMVAAAAAQGLERIIYLGGLGDVNRPDMSEHLRSRHEVGDVLQSGPVPVTVLRAAMILGSGSASFEMLRYLVERLPVMLTPRWVHTPCQPISITSVLHYLQGCLEHDETIGQSFDIGDLDVLTYKEIIDIYAQEAGLRKRLIIPVPLLTPKLSSYWIHVITPVPASIARPLAQGLSIPVICKDNRIRSIIPHTPLSCRETIQIALEHIKNQQVETCWTDAGCLLPPEWAYCGDAQYTGGTVLECGYRVRIKGTPKEIWKPIQNIGGDTGWYFGKVLWKLRGDLDRFIGGFGLRRGRRHPTDLRVGDAVDFWRVLEVEPERRLVLLAEMKLPGEALLEFRITSRTNDSELELLSRFLPKGLGGILYWYAFYPFHEWIFGGMLRALAGATGKPMVRGPERFTPRLPDSCKLPQ